MGDAHNGACEKVEDEEAAAPTTHHLVTRRRRGRAPAVRIDLRKVSYRVHARGGPKHILKGVSLSLTPGQLVGVLGPSGCGKTSLLRVLQGHRQVVRHLEGDVFVNGAPRSSVQSHFRMLCALVPQDNILLPCFTVQETLTYAALLRLPQRWAFAEKASVVNDVIADLHLTECRDVRVGCMDEGLSGGQRRRLSIGLELLVDPSVLLLDEPTSGLDSSMAEDLCSLFRDLVEPWRCLVCSIHQPSTRVFMGFDRVLLLVGGRVAFDGPVDRVAEFFTSIRFELPLNENPADVYMRLLRAHPEAVLKAWETSRGHYTDDAEGAAAPGGRAFFKGLGAAESPGHTSAWWQLCVLLVRMLADNCKDPGKFLSGVLMECTVGLLIGLTWLQEDLEATASIFPVMGVFIMLTTLSIFDSAVGVSLRFPTTRLLHFREYSNGYYRLLPYYLASVISSCLFICIYQAAQALIVFFMVGLTYTPRRLALYLSVLALASCVGACLGFMMGVITPSMQRIQQMVTPFLMPMLIFSGYMRPLPSIPHYLRWLYYISPFQYVYTTLLRIQYVGFVFKDCPHSSAAMGICVPTGEGVLRSLDIDPNGTHRAMLALLGMVGALCVGGYTALHLKSR